MSTDGQPLAEVTRQRDKHVGWIDLTRLHKFHPLGCRCSISAEVHTEANAAYAAPSEER